MRNQIFFTLLLLLIYGSIPAQSVKRDVAGFVFESETDSDVAQGEVPLAQMNVSLLRSGIDSTVLYSTFSDEKGGFRMKDVSLSSYLVRISGVGFKTRYLQVSTGDFLGNLIDLGKIYIEEAAVSIGEVTVTAPAPDMLVKGDTLEYNPNAYISQESSVAEDVLKQLPGVEVEMDGKVSVAGKEVKRIFVDGKEFFGKDPKMATKNLAASMIDRIQVIEKKSDVALLTGVDDGERETIINITLKKSMKNGWFGNVTAGAGNELSGVNDLSPRYSTNGMVTRFKNDDSYVLVGSSNNINNQGFTDNGNAVKANKRGNNTNNGRGIFSSHSVGLNASKLLPGGTQYVGNMQYNYTDKASDHSSFRKNLLIDSVSYRKSRSSEKEKAHNLVFENKIEYKLDSLNTVMMRGNFSYNNSMSGDRGSQSTHRGDRDSTKVNETNTLSDDSSSGFGANLEATWAHRFREKGRRVNFSGSTSWNHSDGNGVDISSTRFIFSPRRDKSLNQRSGVNSSSGTHSFYASYVEPLGSAKNTLQLSYNFKYSSTSNIKQTYDYDSLPGTYSKLNPDYSKSIRNIFASHSVGITFNTTQLKYSFAAGVKLIPSYIRSQSFIKDGLGEGVDSVLFLMKGRHVVNISPQVNFRYRFANSTFSLDYQGNTRQPSISQLDPTPNTTNPLSIRTGNPDLLPSFPNTVSAKYTSSNRSKGQSLTVNGDYSFVVNEIVNYTEYEEETGVQYTRPVNENGSWNSSLNVLFNTPLNANKKLTLSTNSRISYNNRIGYITISKQSQRNISKTTLLQQRIGLGFRNKWYNGQFRAVISYTGTHYTLDGKSSQEAYNYRLTYNTQIYLPSNWFLASDINYSANRGLSSGYNKDEVLWNASVGKYFLKRKQALLQLQWTDILRQKLNIGYNQAANYIESNEFNTLTSYCMLSLTYKFTSSKSNKKKTNTKNNQK